jgi:8-oxo-dGTP pyrophosphatase MutT (NUDIX family)
MQKGVDYIGVCVVFHCNDGNGKLLMHKRSNNCRDEQGHWDVGGGGLELGENVLECVRKEIKEEYCALAHDIEFMGYRDVHRSKNGIETHWIALDFKARLNPEEVGIGEPHKFDDIGWFDINSLPSPLHSQLPEAFEKYYKIKY